MRDNTGRSRSPCQSWRYQNNAASSQRRFKHLAPFFSGIDHEERLFDPETLCEVFPDINEAGYTAYLLDHFADHFYQDFCGIRVRPSRVFADMRSLDADIFGYNINASVGRAVYRVGSVEDGAFRLEPGWARLYGPDDRIPVPPRYDAITEQIKRAGFLPRHLARGSDRACFAVRGYGEHVVVFTYGAVLEEGYLQRIKEALLQAGVKSEEGLLWHCKICKADSAVGTLDEAMLVISVQ